MVVLVLGVIRAEKPDNTTEKTTKTNQNKLNTMINILCIILGLISLFLCSSLPVDFLLIDSSNKFELTKKSVEQQQEDKDKIQHKNSGEKRIGAHHILSPLTPLAPALRLSPLPPSR